MLDENHPVGRLIPKEKRSDELEAAVNSLGATDMGTLADALIAGHKAKTEGETLQTRVTELTNQSVGLVKVPGADAPEAEIKTFSSMIGVPENISGYGLANLEASDEGKAMLTALIESGVRKGPAEKLMAKMETMNAGVLAAQSTATAARLTEVKSSLGDKGFDLARKGAEVMFPGDEMASIREKYLNDPDAIAAIATVGRASIETPKVFQRSAQGGSGGDLYPGMSNRGMK